MTWNIWHSTESLLRLQSPLYTELWLWPDGANLGRHTLFPGYSVVGIVVKLATWNNIFYPFYAYRAVVFLSFVLLFVLMYVFLRELSCGRVSAAVVATAFAYCDFFVTQAQHPQFLAMFIYPLIALLALRFCRTPSLHILLSTAVTVAGSVYFTEMVAFGVAGLIIFFGLMLTSRHGRGEIWQLLRQTRLWWWPVSAASALLVAAPFLWAYSRAGEVSLYESSKELSASLTGLLVPHWLPNPLLADAIQALFGVQYNENMSVWLGYVIPSLALVSPFLLARQRFVLGPLLVVAGIFLVLSLGPDLTIGDTTYPDVLPYYDFTRIPPFTSFRAPGRLVSVALFFLSIPASLSLNRISQLGRVGRLVLSAFCLLAAVECYTPDGNVERSDLSGWSLSNVFATPSTDFVELVTSRCQPGPCVTLPPSFYDTAGVFAQIFHHQPIFAGCWMSRWSEDQQQDFYEYHDVFNRSLRQQNPALLATWLKNQGIKNILLTNDGELTEEYLSNLSRMINIIDARATFRPELDPFAHAFSRR